MGLGELLEERAEDGELCLESLGVVGAQRGAVRGEVRGCEAGAVKGADADAFTVRHGVVEVGDVVVVDGGEEGRLRVHDDLMVG